MEQLIYFDYNSTTPYSPSVRSYLEQGMLEDWYNPASVYSQAQILHHKARECRKFIADYLNCSPQYLFFTSGGTESINTILSQETLKLNKLLTFITSHLEHHATIKKIDYLSAYPRVQLEMNNKNNTGPYWVLNNEQGEFDLNHLEKLCFENPHSLLSLLSANNETGVITDIQAISRIARQHHCLVHLDAVQSLGKMPVDLEKWDVDFASFSGHKIGAMKGIGLLYARKPFAPLMYGGGQERGLRPGTHNYPAIQSFKLAVQDIDLNKQKYVRQLKDHLENNLSGNTSHLENNLSGNTSHLEKTDSDTGAQKITRYERGKIFVTPFEINCKKANRLPNTSSIYCGGISNQVVLLHLSKRGICASAGSACNTGSPEPSHVITMLNIKGFPNKDYARSCIRISLSPANTKREVDFLIQSLRELGSPSSHLSANPPTMQTI